MLHVVIMSPLSSLVCDTFSVFPVFLTLKLLKSTGQVFPRLSLGLGLIDVSFRSMLGLRI